MPPRVDEARVSAHVREATPEEAQAIYPTPPGYETWVGVLDRAGQLEGHICLTRQGEGQIFGHDTECHSPDAADANKLWRAAKKQCKKWGQDRVFIHIEIGSPKRLLEFWEGRGAKARFMVYELSL